VQLPIVVFAAMFVCWWRACKCFIAVAVCHGCSIRAGGDPVKFAAMQTSLLSFLPQSCYNKTISYSLPC